jgi:ribosomal protein S18 acetylase RimI-like enzyme
VLYRRYKPEDFAALYAIEEACFQPPLRFGRQYMRQFLDNPDAATWIAEQDGRMAGFAIVEWMQDENAIVAYIQTIEVAAGQRRQGVGGELLRQAEASASAAGARTIWLHVDAENSAAIHLYERRGYAGQGRAEHYYARNRAALVYSKSGSVDILDTSVQKAAETALS